VACREWKIINDGIEEICQFLMAYRG